MQRACGRRQNSSTHAPTFFLLAELEVGTLNTHEATVIHSNVMQCHYVLLGIMRAFDRATHWHWTACGLVTRWMAPWVYARPFPHEICPLPSDTCISPGIECQRMSAGLLHMWLAFLSCSLSLPQLPPPAPLWKPRLTEPSLAPSSLSDTRSISCVPRASNWLARQHALAETTAPGVASTPPAKVSVTQGFVDRFYSLGVTLETHIHLTRN